MLLLVENLVFDNDLLQQFVYFRAQILCFESAGSLRGMEPSSCLSGRELAVVDEYARVSL